MRAASPTLLTLQDRLFRSLQQRPGTHGCHFSELEERHERGQSLARGRAACYLCIIAYDSAISNGGVMSDDSCAPKLNIVLPA